MENLGELISPILVEIENSLLDHQIMFGNKTNFTDDGFRAGIFIFSRVILDKMWELQEKENMTIENRINMANSVGNNIRDLVKTYTNIDTHNLYIKDHD